MPETILALPTGDQTTLSERVRVMVKRIAASNGGLKSLIAKLGLPYKRAWEQLNRNQGVLVDMLPALTAAGIDEPLRKVADACGYDVLPKPQFLRTYHAPTKPIRSHALDIHHAASALSSLLEAGLEDQRLDPREIEALEAEAFKVNKQLGAFLVRIKGGGR